MRLENDIKKQKNIGSMKNAKRYRVILFKRFVPNTKYIPMLNNSRKKRGHSAGGLNLKEEKML